MGLDMETKPSRRSKAGTVHALPGRKSGTGSRRAWTIKGVAPETVASSRKAAQTQGMFLSLWVEKQLKDAAERELNGTDNKKLAADLLCTKIENIESTLRSYIGEQGKRIEQLQDEIRRLNNHIVPPLLEVLADRLKKRA